MTFTCADTPDSRSRTVTAAVPAPTPTKRTSPAGALGEVKNLSPTTESASPPQVHVSDAGTAVVAWIRGATGAVVYRTRSAAGTLGTTVTVAAPTGPGGLGMTSGLKTASNAAGRIVFMWQEFNGLFSSNKARVRSGNGSLGPVFEVTGPGLYSPTAAVDPDGNVTFAFISMTEGGNVVQARRRTVNGSMGVIRTVSTPGTGAFPDQPHVVADGAGKATVAWGESVGEMRARTVTPTGTMSPVLDLNGG